MEKRYSYKLSDYVQRIMTWSAKWTKTYELSRKSINFHPSNWSQELQLFIFATSRWAINKTNDVDYCSHIRFHHLYKHIQSKFFDIPACVEWNHVYVTDDGLTHRAQYIYCCINFP